MKKTGFECVREFHQAFGHPTRTQVTVPDVKTVKLRLALILEEFTELAEAVLKEDSAAGKVLLSDLENAMNHLRALEADALEVDVVAVADALTDINYVTYGAGHCFGIDLDACMQVVQASNMSKLGRDGKPIYNEHGKIMKGPDYFPPDLSVVLGVSEACE